MQILIVIPTHNEEKYIAATLYSLLCQTYTNFHILVTNDNSTDGTATILENYNTHPQISVIHKHGDQRHLPGTKVVEAFYFGLQHHKDPFDIICKFDADLIFPKNYLYEMVAAFQENPQLGMFGGILYSLQNGKWQYENIAKKSHLRGPIKSYRKSCFDAMSGIRPTIGWDSIDVLLAKYYGFETHTDTSLVVKHCKPTAAIYHGAAKYKQGEALYKMRYDLGLVFLTALKQSFRLKSPLKFLHYWQGYFQAFFDKKVQAAVSKEEGAFIRKWRWKQLGKK
ncbi:MAG: glycosyltransferase [Flavobacteriaceae bacterium]|nr:glycosyltransferase [Flavobacteriaceae bacterium]